MGSLRVLRWRDRLAESDPSQAAEGLSAAGAREAFQASLSALNDEALADAWARSGQPFERATMVVARTVFTAPLEWCAVLLGRGTAVHLKHPEGLPGLSSAMVTAARAERLPLTASADRTTIQSADLVVGMGADSTIERIAKDLPPGVRFLGFGSRFSVAWIRDLRSLNAVAYDAALYDGRGCMSPVAVFTDHPEAGSALADAMQTHEAVLPRGETTSQEQAQLRTRRALARVVGMVHEGPGWSVHELPSAHFSPAGLPRSLMLHQVKDGGEFVRLIRPHLSKLSTIGTDEPALVRELGVRSCAPGEMQRPPLNRRHDGIDWLSATLV